MKPKLPGRWLLWLGRLLFDRSVYEAAIVPAVADLQTEWTAANTGRERLVARWRGLVAFASLVIVSPVVFRAWPGRERGDGAPVVTLGLMAIAGCALYFWWMPLSQPVVALMNFDQHRLLAGLAWASVFIGPIATGSWLILTRHWPNDAAGASPALAMLTLVFVAMPVALGTAAIIDVLSGIGAKGSANLQVLLSGVQAATMPVFFALLASVLSLAAIARLAFDRTSNLDRPMLGAVSSISIAAFGAAALVGVHFLLQLQHRVASALHSLLTPPQLRPAGMRDHMQFIGEADYLVHLVMGAVVATVVVLVFAFATWRALRDHRQPVWFGGVSRVMAIVALAGAVWHTTVAYRDTRALANLDTTMNQWPGPPPPNGR